MKPIALPQIQTFCQK
jgi:uncharacterized protein